MQSTNNHLFAIESMQLKYWLVILIVGVLLFVGWRLVLFSRDGEVLHAKLKFGPASQIETTLIAQNDRVRILDGNDVIVDRKFFGKADEPIQIQLPDSSVTYEITEICDASTVDKRKVMVYVTIREGDQIAFQQYCDLEVRTRSSEPAIAHFDGPLTITPQTIRWEIPESLALKRGGESTDLRLEIGTKDKATGCWTMVEWCVLDKRQDAEEPQSNANETGELGWMLAQHQTKFPKVHVNFLDGDNKIEKEYTMDQFC